MLFFLLNFLSFSLPKPFYHNHIIKVIPHDIFDSYKNAQQKCDDKERRLAYSFLDGTFKEYLTEIEEYEPDVINTLQDEYKDSEDHEATYSFAYDAKTLNDCLSQIPSNVVLVTITLYTNVSDSVDFGKLPYKVSLEINTDLDDDVENDIVAFNDEFENLDKYFLMIDAIKTGKVPDDAYQSSTFKQRPKIITKDEQYVDFSILGGNFSGKISTFSSSSNIKYKITSSDFIVDKIESFDFILNGQYKFKSQGIVVNEYQNNIENLISIYEPVIVYYKIYPSSVYNFTIEFNNVDWTVNAGEDKITLKKQGSVKQFGLYTYVDSIDYLNFFLPKVCEIAGDIKIDIKHDEVFYELYYYFEARGVEYKEEYNHIPELLEMIEKLFFHRFPDLYSKIQVQNHNSVKSHFGIRNKILKLHLLENDNQEFKSQIKVESTGPWNQVKTLPKVTFSKPNHVTIDKSNLQSNVNWNDQIYEESNDYPNDDGKKKGNKSSSSKKDSDDVSELSSYTLANFSIHDVYIGASTVVDFPLGFKFMQKARNILGKLIPAPNFLHTAVWVGPKDSNNQTLGAIFVYGQYSSIIDDNTYLSKDGARSYVMSLHDFIEYFNYCHIKKLEPQRNFHLYDFIKEVKTSGSWNIEKYNWPTNNCQHFTAACLKIMKTTRKMPKLNDWTNFPSSIYNAIKTNEIQILKDSQEK